MEFSFFFLVLVLLLLKKKIYGTYVFFFPCAQQTQGPVKHLDGDWVGLQLPTATGDSNGVLNDVTYFRCKNKSVSTCWFKVDELHLPFNFFKKN